MIVASMIDLTMPRPPPSVFEAVASAITDPPAEKTIEDKKNKVPHQQQQ